MKISHIVVMIIRLFSIGLGLYSLNSLVFTLGFYFENNHFSIINITYNFSIILIAILLWFFPYTTSKILTGYSSPEREAVPSVSAEQISSIVFICLGTYLLFNVISDAGYWIFLHQNAKQQSEILSFSIEDKALMFATCLEGVLVVCLFLGRKGLLKTLIKLRQ